MKALDEYLKLQKQIYKYFGYVEDWVVIPIDDRRGMYWTIDDDEVHFGETANDVGSGEGFSDEIYKQRFLKKWVYRGKDYTMICVDTHTDGNKFLAIFDNSKEIKE